LEEHDADVAHPDENGGQPEGGFLGPPRDWIDRFSRHFRPVVHTHLQGGNVREILPWLRISANLDPHKIETYTVAAYWLRTNLKNPDEAEQFLREGLRANPGSYEILFELGKIYYENRHNAAHARNLWELAVRRWHQREDREKEPDFKALHDIATELGHLEEEAANYAKAIEWLKVEKEHAPNPEVVQAHIDAVRAKMKSTPAGNPSAP